MQKPINWPNHPSVKLSLLPKLNSPFDKGQVDRPLNITLHSSALINLDDYEKSALDILLEFARVPSPHLSIVATEPGDYPFMEIHQPKENYIPVIVRYSEQDMTHSGILDPDLLSDTALDLINLIGEDTNNYEEALHDLIVAEAHRATYRDLLVTSSKYLLKNRDDTFIKYTNPCLPSEALKIMGLLLRSRNDFHFAGQSMFDRGMFYWVLTRYMLPEMWRYFSACVYSNKLGKDGMTILGQSVLVRCERALQAKDEIGRLFYSRRDNNTSDEIMYHFDYFTLLLSGALDAQARVAFYVYEITSIKERFVNFRNSDFVNKLEAADPELAQFINGDYFQDFSLIISKTRNTIHGAGLLPLMHSDINGQQTTLINVPKADANSIWSICEKYGLPTEWGIQKIADLVTIEPYTFSKKLIEHTLKITNEIARLTQVEKLFPDGFSIPTTKSLGNDPTFSHEIGERLLMLV